MTARDSVGVLGAALDYARRRWHVFVVHSIDERGCCTCGKPDCQRPGKHPIGDLAPHGLNDATCDERLIRAWFAKAPWANVAIACGWHGWQHPGIVGFDVDPRHGGDDGWRELELAHGVPATLEALTGGGGRHVLFRRPSIFTVHELGNGTGALPDGIDVRADGGYIVAPPSLHASGRRYAWSVDGNPDEHELAKLPPWLLDLLLDRSNGRRQPLAALSPETIIEEGRRDDTLAKYGGAMRRKGFDGDAIAAALLVMNRKHCRPPLSERDVQRIARSVARYEPGDPVIAAGGEIDVEVDRDPLMRQLLTGGAVFDLPDVIPAVWGSGQRVAWADNERLILCAPQGAGKTTLAQRLALARCGLSDTVLDLPVADDGRRVLYVAADRPAQALRSLRRMPRADQRAVLDERLLIWKGAPPVNVVTDPRALLAWLQRFDNVGTVVIDSLKDLAPALGKDEVGSAVDHALRHVSDADVQVLALHHPRKAQNESSAERKPRGLDDVYGSTWLTGGSGSVLLLWAQPGELVIELSTLKPIADPVGPMTIVLDPDKGAMSVEAHVDAETVLRAAKSTGVSALELARAIGWKGSEPAAKQRARRALDRLVVDGLADREEGTKTIPARWFWKDDAS
jgi:replicative DNA helicase